MKTRLAMLAVLAPFAALAQTSASTTVSPNGFRGVAHFGPAPPFSIPPVTGAPYSAEQVNESVQTLADGTHITRTMPAMKFYRDSLGRTRTERALFSGPVGRASTASESQLIVEIDDPVGHVRYTLDTANRVAHRQAFSAPAAGTTGYGGGGGGSRAVLTTQPGLMAPPADATRPETKTEPLPSQTIEGVLAEGRRTTTTWPVGAQGNDRPITIASETWTSPELKVVLLSKTSDPRIGEHTQKLANIVRGEPDASMFQPPPDYTVVDEKGEFTIQWGTPQR